MKFYLPDWEDRLDPRFDFEHDLYSEDHKRNPYVNDEYAHRLFSNRSPYDGMLVSISNFESKIKIQEFQDRQMTIRGQDNIRKYLKIGNHSKIKVMGDCGAFSYVAEPEPPEFYSVERVARIYSALKFDSGVSVDHIAVNSYLVKENDKRHYVQLKEADKKRRVEITLENAKKFRHVCEENDYNFTPIGVAQGYDLPSYANSVEKLLDYGYTYIALGGLVQYANTDILNILKEVKPLLKNTKLHLFGVLRPSQMQIYESYGVTSFDSASYFRKAWLRSGQNYITPNGEWYAAVRVPYSWNKNVIERAKEEGVSLYRLKSLEYEALEALRKYEDKKSDINETLSRLMDYDRFLIRTSDAERNLEEKYKRTLRERPWLKCTCEMCRGIGIEIVIFRGTNRNKRRGFHNTWVVKNHLMKKRQVTLPTH